MGFGGISIWQLLIVFGIIVLIFGTSKLKNMGSDLGGAIKGFKKAINDDEDKKASEIPENAQKTQAEETK